MADRHKVALRQNGPKRELPCTKAP
jgi:hypothetical protein